MKKALFPITIAAAVACADIQLPTPNTEGGMALNEALAKRATTRAYDSSKALSMQQVSDMLWAANGITRPDGRRTAPTARNDQEIEIYLYLPEGVFKWNGKDKLIEISKEDKRKEACPQPFVEDASAILVYVVDYTKQRGYGTESWVERKEHGYACVDAGFIGQNVYLHAAANGLASVFLGSVNRDVIAKTISLPATSEILFAQTVAFPK